MEALIKLTRITGLFIVLMVTLPALGQEYDDLYFSSKDRKKSEEPKVTESLNVYQAYTANNYTDEYSTNKVNPEYIARYQASKDYSSDSEYASSDDNASYSQPSFSNISYYPEEQQYADYESQNAPTVINNYYGNTGANNGWNNNSWNNNGFYDPWMNTSIMWSPFYNRARFSIGFGYGCYDPWNSWAFGGNYYSGFWGNPVAGMGFYDPWYYGGGWGYGSRWNRYGYAYNAGFNNGLYYGGWSEGVSSSPRRDVVVGSRYSRGGSVVQGPRSGNSRTSVPTGGSRANLANNDTRDYSRTQNEYYARSRSGIASNSGTSSRVAVASTSTRSRTNTNNNGTNVNPGRPSTNSNYGRGNSGSQVSSSNTANRRYSTSTTPSSSSRSNSSYSSGSSSRSRSSSSYSSGSSSTPSRSSYTPSSSSSGSSSRSSSSFSSGGGSSRSSSGGSSSGGSRSSGGGSSSSRSRGGN